jgi:hypothetical protein
MFQTSYPFSVAQVIPKNPLNSELTIKTVKWNWKYKAWFPEYMYAAVSRQKTSGKFLCKKIPHFKEIPTGRT